MVVPARDLYCRWQRRFCADVANHRLVFAESNDVANHRLVSAESNAVSVK